MIEYDVAQVIADNTSLTLGTDLFADHLPDGTDYGVFIKVATDLDAYASVGRAKLNIFITYADYKTCRDTADDIKDVIKEYLGVSSSGSWSCGGSVLFRNFGQNLQGDHMVVLITDVYYENGG